MTTQPLAVGFLEEWSDDTPVIANAKRIVREDAPIPTFGKNVWSLAAMAPPRKRGTLNCNFEPIPLHFRIPVKKAMWILINEGKPLHVVRRGSTRTKQWVGANSILTYVDSIRAFLAFVARQTPEVRSLRGIISETMDAYVGTLAERIDPGSEIQHYTSIRLLHDLTARLHASERLPAPAWVDDTVFVSRKSQPDNATQPMPDAVLTPMLLWSVAFIEQFAEDIFSARAAVKRYAPTTVQDIPLTTDQAKQIAIAWTKDHGNSLPWTDTGNPGVALRYMCFILNWETYFRHGGFKEKLKQLTGMVVSDRAGCPIPTPVHGRIHGKCWQPGGLDYYRLTFSAIDLQSACLLLLGLDSASRPQELLKPGGRGIQR